MLINKYSQLYKLSQYVALVDLGLMATVLQQKQQKYDSNKQLINQTYNGLLSLDLARDIDREYLNEKANQIMNKINSFGSVNLSNDNITSQLTGIITNTSRDERIKNSLIQTQKLRNLQKKQEDMYKLKMEGKKDILYNSSTEWFDNRRINKYLSDLNENAVFEGSGTLTLYSDWQKTLDESVKNIKGQYYSDFNLVLGSDNLYVRQTDGKRVTKEQIRNEAILSLNQDELKSMQIDGMFNYKDYDLLRLKDSIDDHFANILIESDNEIKRLEDLKLVSEEKQKTVIQNQIDSYKENQNRIKSNRDSYINSISKDLDSVKARLYQDKFIFDYGTRKQYNDVTTNKIELNQALVKKRQWAEEDRQFNFNQEKFREDVRMNNESIRMNNHKIEYDKLNLLKDANNFKNETGVHLDVNSDGTFGIDGSAGKLNGFYLNGTEEDKKNYGNSLDDELANSNKELSNIIKKAALDLAFKTTGKTRLSNLSESGFESDAQDFIKKENLYLEQVRIFKALMKQANDASLGIILNTLSISDLNKVNEFNLVKAERDAILRTNNQFVENSLKKAMSEKGLNRTDVKTALSVKKVEEEYQTWKQNQIGYNLIKIINNALGGQDYEKTSFSTFLKQSKYKDRYNFYMSGRELLVNSGVFDNAKLHYEESVKNLGTGKVNKNIMLEGERFDRIKNKNLYANFESKLNNLKETFIQLDGSEYKVKSTDTVLNIVSIHLDKGVLLQVGDKTEDLENSELGKNLRKNYVYVKLNSKEADLLGLKYSVFAKNNLYYKLESSIELNNYVDYQVLHTTFPVKAKFVKTNLETNDRNVNIFIKVLLENGGTEDRLLEGNFENLTQAAIFLNELVKESSSFGLKDINELFVKLKLK